MWTLPTVPLYYTVVLMIRVQLDSDQPIEEQIVRQLRQAVAKGQLEPGERLASARQLAADLGVHWNTVARAYRRLASEGLLAVRHGRGVAVRDSKDWRGASRAVVLDRVREQLRRALVEAHLGGLRGGDLQRLLRDELALYEKGGDT